MVIASSGRNHLVGVEPHTVGLNASLTLVALVPKEVSVPVTLLP